MRGPVTSLRALKEQTQSEDHDLSFWPTLALHGAPPPPQPAVLPSGGGEDLKGKGKPSPKWRTWRDSWLLGFRRLSAWINSCRGDSAF